MSQHDAIHKQKRVKVPSAEVKSDLQRAAVNSSSVNDLLSSPEQSIDSDTRASVEPQFSHDFSKVPIHADTKPGAIAPGKEVEGQQKLIFPKSMIDDGQTGTGTAEAELVEWESKIANLDVGEFNEWGEIDGDLSSDVNPHAFVDGGKTGTGIVNWAGGNGAAGDQGAGTIELV